jgi:hypothetical protein
MQAYNYAFHLRTIFKLAAVSAPPPHTSTSPTFSPRKLHSAPHTPPVCLQIYNYAFTYTASKLAAVSARTAIGASFSKLEGLFSLFLTADLPADVLPAHPSGQLAGPPGPAAAGGILSFSLVAVLGAVWAWRRGTRSRRRHAGEHAARPAKWRRPTQEVLL